jgi:hypothetical protein
MNTYFVRHTKRLSIDSDTFDHLWRERKIAIHFPRNKSGDIGEKDNVSIDPEEYEGYDAAAISTLVELAEHGGYVCAQYKMKDECLVGLVEPGTKIELLKGWWSDKKSRKAIFKSLKLKNAKVMKEHKLAHVLVGRPRQGTIKRWHLVGERIKYLVEGKILPPTLESLLPSQQEILCSEYLRLPQAVQQISHLLLPAGRTMKDIDICGVDPSGQLVYAQVTFLKPNSARLRRKLDRLKEYSDDDNNKLIMFCDCDEQDFDEEVIIFPIREAFRIFTSTESGKVWLEKALL